MGDPQTDRLLSDVQNFIQEVDTPTQEPSPDAKFAQDVGNFLQEFKGPPDDTAERDQHYLHVESDNTVVSAGGQSERAPVDIPHQDSKNGIVKFGKQPAGPDPRTQTPSILPEDKATAKFARDISRGTLQLPTDTLTNTEIDERAWQLQQRFQDTTPKIAASAMAVEEQTGTRVLAPINRLLARIELTDTTPQEIWPVAELALTDYVQGLDEGLQRGLISSPGRVEAIREQPQLAQEVVMKLLSVDDDELAEETLRKDGPFGNEVEMAGKLRGFTRFLRQKERFYRSRHRLGKVLGQDPRINYQEGPLHQAVPDSSPYDANVLGTRVPWLLSLQQAATERAATDENMAAIEADAIANLGIGTQIGIGIHEMGGLPGLATESGMKALEWLDDGTFGLLGQMIHDADKILGTGGHYQGIKSTIVRPLLTGPEADNLENRYNYMLASYPDQDPDTVRNEAGKLFTTAALVGQLPQLAKQITGVDVGTLGGTDASGLSRMFEKLGGFFDSPTTALMTLGIIPKTAKEIKGAKARRLQRIEDGVFDPLKDANFNDLVSEARGSLMRDVLQRMSEVPRNADMAKRLLNRFVTEMNDRGLALGPELFGKLQASWTSLESASKSRYSGAAAEGFRRGMQEVKETFQPDSVFESARIRQPSGRQLLDPKANLNVIDSALEYMAKASVATGKVGTLPTELQGPKGTQLQRAAEAHLNEVRVRNRSLENHTSARRVLNTVADDLTHTVEGLTKSADRMLRGRTEKVDIYNSEIRRSVGRGLEMERKGGRIPEARKIVRSKQFADALLASENTRFAKQWLFNDKGQLNRRLATNIGGPELVKEINHLLNERKTAAKLGSTATVDGMILDAVQSHAREFVREATAPEWRGVAPNPRPRTRAFRELQKKLDAAEEAGTPIKLSKTEEAMLNEFRPRGAPLSQQFLTDIANFDRGLKSIGSRARKYQELREKVEAYKDKVENAAPGDLRRFRIDKKIHAEVAKYMDEPLSEILYGDPKKGGGFRLSSGLPTELKSWRDVWSDLTREIPQERRLLEKGLIKLNSFELSTLPIHLQIMHGFEEMVNQRAGMNWLQMESAQILVEGERLNPAQRIQLREAIRTGKIPKDLPREAAEYLHGRMWKQRVEQLRKDLEWEMMPPDKFAEWSRGDYLPELYERDPVLADRVARDLDPSFRSTEIDRLMQPSRHNFRTRTRTDTFDVSYLEKGKPKLQKGFKSAAEANEWAKRNLKETTKYEVRDPYPEDLKVAEGLRQDPLTTHGEVMERIGHDRALFAFQRVASQTNLTRPHAAMRDFLLEQGVDAKDALKSGRIRVDLGDGHGMVKYVRVRNSRLPHLNGKWVRQDLLSGAADIMQGYRVFDAITEGLREGAEVAQGKQYASLAKFGREIVGATNHMLSTTHVPMNFLSYARGWMGNLGYANLAGFNLWNPINMGRLSVYMADIMKDLAPSAGKALKHLDAERLFLKTRTGTYTQELLEADLIHAGEPVFNAEMSRAVKKFEKGTSAVRARFDDINRRLESYFDAEGTIKNPTNAKTVAALQKKASTLEAELAKTVGQRAKEFTKEWLGATFDNTIRGKGEGVRKTWAAYVFGSGDTPMKIATYRFLRDVAGLDKAEALGRIKDFFQQIHSPGRIGQWLPGFKEGIPTEKVNKALGQSISGSMFMGFKTEQLRILENAMKKGKGRLMKYLGSMAAWNSFHVQASGESLDEWTQAFAQRHKLKPSPLTSALALLQGVRLRKRLDNGVDMIGADNLLGTFFLEPFTPFGKGVSQMVAHDEDAGLAQKAVGGILGAMAEGFSMSSAAMSLVHSVTRGSTAFGTPVRPDTFGRILRETFLPPMLGGYEWPGITRQIEGNDINPQTYQPKTFSDFIKSRVFGIRKLYGTPQRLQAAYHETMAFRNKDSGRAGSHVSDQLFEERKHSIVAHNAVDPVTGRVNRDRQREVLEADQLEHQKYLVGPTGDTRGLGLDEEAVNRSIEATSLPKVLYNVNRENLTTMMQVYTLWRRADPNPSGPWDARLNQLIVNKLRNGNTDAGQVRAATTYARELLDDPGLKPEVQRRVRGWIQEMTNNFMESATR